MCEAPGHELLANRKQSLYSLETQTESGYSSPFGLPQMKLPSYSIRWVSAGRSARRVAPRDVSVFAATRWHPRRSHFLVILAVLLLLAASIYLYLFGGPYWFVQFPLREASLQHLLSSPATSNPVDAADEYLHGLFPPSDRPERSKLEITIRQISEQETVVTVIDRFCKDDSIEATCDRLTMRRENGAWMPTRHQAAWQGRDLIGWTTQTPS